MRSKLLLVLCCLAVASCADYGRGPYYDAGLGTNQADGGASGFEAVHPLFLQSCQACHVFGGLAGATGLQFSEDPQTDHATVLEYVDLDDPAASQILRKPTAQDVHAGGEVWAVGSSEYAAVLDWIEQGARP